MPRILLVGLSFALLCVAWCYPFVEGPSEFIQQQIAALMCCSLWLLCMGGAWRKGLLWCLVGLFSLLCVRSAFYLADTVVTMVMLLLACGAIAAGSLQNNQIERAQLLAWCLTAIAVLNACVGVLQFLGLEDQLWPWVVDAPQRGVAYGNLRQPNLYASLLCWGLASSLYLTGLGKISWKMNLFLGGLMVAAVAACGSRIGGLEILGISFLHWLWRKPDGASKSVGPTLWWQSVFLIFMYSAWQWFWPVLAALHGFESHTTLAKAAATASDSRLDIWLNAWDLALQQPWWGWGWREYGFAYFIAPSSHWFRGTGLSENTHNLPLQLAVELGLPVAIAFIALCAYALWRGRFWVEQLAERKYAWILVFTVGMHSLVEFPLWYVQFMAIAAFAIGLLMPPIKTNIWQHGRSVFLMGVLALLGFSAYAYLDYERLKLAYGIPNKMFPEAKKTAIKEMQNSWLFASSVDYLQVVTDPVSQDNAAQILPAAMRVMHFSAEPSVLTPLLNSAWLLGHLDVYDSYVHRYCRVFPRQFGYWLDGTVLPQVDVAAHVGLLAQSDECIAQKWNAAKSHFAQTHANP